MSKYHINNMSAEKWNGLTSKCIFFGHQSVGYNIIEGIKEIARDSQNVELKIIETKDPLDFKAPIFAHCLLGANEDPIAKISDFKSIIESGIGDRVDIAFFKFCYVDITGETDINNVFQYYSETMEFLRSKYPKVKFIHMTVPLRTHNMSLKARLNRLLGRYVWGDNDNMKRNEFNQMLIAKYKPMNTLFDIALYESMYPNGKIVLFKQHGKKLLSLNPEYTNDGGHLNNKGRVIVGNELLHFLCSL